MTDTYEQEAADIRKRFFLVETNVPDSVVEEMLDLLSRMNVENSGFNFDMSNEPENPMDNTPWQFPVSVEHTVIHDPLGDEVEYELAGYGSFDDEEILTITLNLPYGREMAKKYAKARELTLRFD